MKNYFVLLLLGLAIFNNGCSRSEKIRFDGIYQSETDYDFRKFFRFYPDGTVIVASSTGEATDVIKWLKKEKYIDDGGSNGKYEIKLDKIDFTTTANYGTIVYEGNIIDDNKIKLKIKSLINGNESEKTIFFIKINEDFIEKYPSSVYADSAMSRIWQNTIAKESIYAFENYIKKYPSSAYVDSAENRIKGLMHTRGKLVSIAVSFSLDEAVSGEVKKLYYEGALNLRKNNGKMIRALCPKSLIDSIKGGQILEVEFDKELHNYKVIKIIEDSK